MPKNLVCAECGGHMEMGVIVDRGHGGVADASYWMEGIKEKALWIGPIKTWGKKTHYISALRCTTCGFLKLYAGPDNSESN
jgi:hypothetical protein